MPHPNPLILQEVFQYRVSNGASTIHQNCLNFYSKLSYFKINRLCNVWEMVFLANDNSCRAVKMNMKSDWFLHSIISVLINYYLNHSNWHLVCLSLFKEICHFLIDENCCFYIQSVLYHFNQSFFLDHLFTRENYSHIPKYALCFLFISVNC